MTENNIISRLHLHCKTMTEEEAFAIMDFLDELKQYRAIGTVEEFKALKEKNNTLKALYDDARKEGANLLANAREKAIDDFMTEITAYYEKYGLAPNYHWIKEMARQLKGGTE